MDNEIIELEYEKPKLYKRYMAFFIDITLTFILAMLLFALSGFILNNVRSYQNMVLERNEIQVSSSLYTKDGESVLVYIESQEETFLEKKDYLSICIEKFYNNEDFFNVDEYYSSYQDRKKEYKNDDGNSIFILKDDEYVENNTYLDEDFYDFYYQEIEKYCTGYMFLNQRYKELSSTLVIIFVLLLFFSLMISFLVFFFIVPLILKRGRRTIGMYLFKIGLINAEALNLGMRQYLIRSLFVFFIGFLLDIVTIFIPLIFSITMMHLSKTGQDFFDYMSVSYVVDISKKDIYLNYEEYEKGVMVHSHSLLEDKDITFK